MHFRTERFGVGQRQGACILDHRDHTLDTLGCFAPPHEVAEPANYLRSPQDLPRRLLQHLLQELNLNSARCKKTKGRIDRITEGGQRLVELVGKRRCHLTRDAKTPGMVQLSLQFL